MLLCVVVADVKVERAQVETSRLLGWGSWLLRLIFFCRDSKLDGELVGQLEIRILLLFIHEVHRDEEHRLCKCVEQLWVR